uniref:Uncharacterized protein n=4 Tax=Avena sativa TaxID=4498 RepID=A0ACD5UK17_AVESA
MENTHNELEKKLHDSNATPMPLPLQFLKDITSGFSTGSVLGEGGYGVVYKGVLQSGKIIAVKKLFELRLKEETFQNEVSYLMGIKHQNVVQFVGYCAESRWEAIEIPSGSGKHIFAEIPKRLLCFEYVSNKSLDRHISDETLGLEWNMRYEIIKGICNGLHFLHEECHIVHLDLKPENILMDSTMTPKIGDFGLSRIFGEQQSRIVTNNRAGTCGYMAPEYLTRGVVSNKADIFSLGVIVIEIITGHRDYPYSYQDSADSTATPFQQFIEKVLASWRNKFLSTPNYKSMERSTQQLRQCIAIALRCVDPAMEKRPTAKDIIEMLNGLDKMEANNELQSDAQCKDQLLVMNPTDVLFPAPLSESSRATGIEILAAKASCNPQAASDITNESVQQATPPSIQIIPKEHCGQPMGSLDISQLKPWIITGHDGGYINIFDYETQKSIGSDAGDGNAVSIIKFIERKQWFIVGSFSGYINVYTYQQTKVQKITSFRAKGRLLPVIHSLAVHPTLPYVLSACNGHIQLWDWDKNWQCIRIFERSSFVANQYELAFNPNDTNEFASADTQEIKVWFLSC